MYKSQIFKCRIFKRKVQKKVGIRNTLRSKLKSRFDKLGIRVRFSSHQGKYPFGGFFWMEERFLRFFQKTIKL